MIATDEMNGFWWDKTNKSMLVGMNDNQDVRV